MLVKRVTWMHRRVVYCSWGLYAVRGVNAVQEGYMDVQEGCILSRGNK